MHTNLFFIILPPTVIVFVYNAIIFCRITHFLQLYYTKVI